MMIRIGAIALACAALAPAAAQARDAARLAAIESQIRSLQGELTRMRRDLAARDGGVRAARQEAARAHAEARNNRQANPAQSAG